MDKKSFITLGLGPKSCKAFYVHNFDARNKLEYLALAGLSSLI
jgi:hypothetical protein